MKSPEHSTHLVAGRFNGHVMIVTGAARGMGRAVAVRAGLEGARIMAADYNEQELGEVVAEIRAAGGEADGCRADITSVEDVRRMVETTVARYGQVNILINNAGVMDGGKGAEPAPCHLVEDGPYLRRTMEVNFFGTFHCCREVLKQFLAQGKGGVIINVSSITGVLGSPGTPVYVASKHAVNGLTKAIALDYADHGIRCNSLNMPSTDTPMYRRAMAVVMEKQKNAGASDAASNMVRPGIKMQSLLKRPSTAEEQAAMILFAASDEASYLTGSILLNDGGWSAF
jgi:NAD(P)-dependent dehydrogenase (short-subunit alcohol dehydrogenase family)